MMSTRELSGEPGQAPHHLIHAGEIVTVRSCLGHDTDKLGRPDWGRPPGLTYSI